MKIELDRERPPDGEHAVWLENGEFGYIEVNESILTI
jgi:hypothetical protein